MTDLSARQADVLRAIEESISIGGRPPTLRELGAKLGIVARSAINGHLRAIIRNGYGSRDQLLKPERLATGKPSSRVYSRIPVKDRFWAKVSKDGPVPAHATELGPCWRWLGYTNKRGYALLSLEGKRAKRDWVHRISWELHHGPIPAGLWVLHKCDNPPCTNPEHLFLGTQQDNDADMRRKGRGFTPPGAPGITNPNAKLNPSIVAAIRAACAVGVSRRSLAEQYGVSKALISDIMRRKIWK